MTSFSPIALYYRFGARFCPATKEEWQEEMANMIKSHMRGEPVYIQYIDDKRRTNSIGLLKEFHDLEALINGRPHYLYGYDQSTFISLNRATENDVKPKNINYIRATLKWEGRTNRTNPDPWTIVWLKGYSGPTVWVYNEPETPNITACDRLGREIKVGDFICYILHHFVQSGASIQFGKVTNVTKDGNVYAKNVKLGDSERSEEKKINDNRTIVILTPDLMEQLMMARLSSL